MILVDHSMSHFLSNLPHPPRSRVPRGPGAASGGQPLVSSSSSPVVVPTLMATMNPPLDMTGLLILTLSQGSGTNEDPITLMEPSESSPRVDKGKQPTDEGLQCKRKRAMSVESDKSIPGRALW